MERIGLTLLEIVALLAIGVTLGFTSNALRRDGLDLSKNYFERPVPATRPSPLEPDQVRAPENAAEQPAAAEHPFQVATFEDVLAIINDELYGTGQVILVDARNDEEFAAGYIPGAWRLDPYYVDAYVEELLPVAQAAERIVVYCQGGNCEDSIYAGRELTQMGIPVERIWLYEGGMEEWRARGGPLETGQDE